MSDVFTGTKNVFQGSDPNKREMICTRCRGNFSGDDANVFYKTDPHEVVVLCDNCIREING